MGIASAKGKKSLLAFGEEKPRKRYKDDLMNTLVVGRNIIIPVLVVMFAVCYLIFGIVQVYSRDAGK